jgi:hypothetical protein
MRTIFLLLAITESALARGGGGSSCHGAHCTWDILDGLASIGLIIVNIAKLSKKKTFCWPVR